MSPALHADNVYYSFYSGAYGKTFDTETFNVTIATVLQDYITSFVKTGVPTSDLPGTGPFPVYGANAASQNLGPTRICQVTDGAANERCNWWQLAEYITE
ncbi:hypothetical protein DL98DRAFT_593142 [Cadophora sp. DSE1049]|nr:hypothetical protein DL98DRAFT_593142 [Cadophora sp. DSE1049]